VVERTVRLEVGHSPTLGRGDLRQHPDLLGHLLTQDLHRHVERHPAEARAVVVGHLGTQRHPAAYGLGADRPHGRPGARVEPTGDVGAGHDGEQSGVVGDLLAEVGVEVHPWSGHARMFSPASGNP
jgi:hypothetical protein